MFSHAKEVVGTGDKGGLERTVVWGTGFAFSDTALRAVWQSSDFRTNALETWAWTDQGARRAAIAVPGLTASIRGLLPLSDGRTLVVRALNDRWQLALLPQANSLGREQHVGDLAVRHVRLLPIPTPHALAMAASVDDASRVTLWLVRDTEPCLTAQLVLPPDTELPGNPSWLDTTGQLLGCNQAHAGRVRPVVADLRNGIVAPLPGCPSGSDYRIAHTSRVGGCALLMRSDFAGTTGMAWADSKGVRDVHFPTPTAVEGIATPLAVDPIGRRIALKVDHGAASQLLVYRNDGDGADLVDTPPGILHSIARWSDHGLHLVHSSPAQRADIATVTFTPTPTWHTPAANPADTGEPLAHSEWMDGPAGPIETVVYGGRNWRQAPYLLMALHGGPHQAWRLDFNPFFQRLTSAGITVVAPNQRGSSGYSLEHRDAIRGNWGGPDLEDVCYLAQTLAAERRPIAEASLLLFGVSYGAFLALRAITRLPELWARCALVAPFSSVASLYADASAGVREFLRTSEASDHVNQPFQASPATALRKFPQVLILHGKDDPMIPVTQGRKIRTSLLRANGHRSSGLEYLEVPGGHDVLSPSPDLQEHIVHFLQAK